METVDADGIVTVRRTVPAASWSVARQIQQVRDLVPQLAAQRLPQIDEVSAILERLEALAPRIDLRGKLAPADAIEVDRLLRRVETLVAEAELTRTQRHYRRYQQKGGEATARNVRSTNIARNKRIREAYHTALAESRTAAEAKQALAERFGLSIRQIANIVRSETR